MTIMIIHRMYRMFDWLRAAVSAAARRYGCLFIFYLSYLFIYLLIFDGGGGCAAVFFWKWNTNMNSSCPPYLFALQCCEYPIISTDSLTWCFASRRRQPSLPSWKQVDWDSIQKYRCSKPSKHNCYLHLHISV